MSSTWWKKAQWRGVVVEVHDGDTLTVLIDRGWEDQSTKHIRLRGCNARELDQPGGPEAGRHLQALIPPGTPVLVQNIDWDKYANRNIGDVLLPSATFLYGGPDVASQMISDGYATGWDGKGPKRVPVWPIPASKAKSG